LRLGRAVALVAVLAAGAGAMGPAPSGSPPRAASWRPVAGPLTRLLFVGTSLTARSTWPEIVGRAVEACRGVPVTVVRIARPGANSAWGAAQSGRIRNAAADVAVVEFVVNDAALHRGVGQVASAANHRTILEAAREGGTRAALLVVTGPVLGRPGLLRPFLERYAAVYGDLDDGSFAQVVDTRGSWPADAAALAALIPDGLHPTDAAMAAHVARSVSDRLCAFAGKPNEG
jgi:hypothetical protein